MAEKEAKEKQTEEKKEAPYQNKSDLPQVLRETLPDEAKEIYLKTYRQSWEEYQEAEGGEASREAVAHRNAMFAVKQEYVHHDDTGKWYPKGEAPEEEEEKEGIVDQLRDLI